MNCKVFKQASVISIVPLALLLFGCGGDANISTNAKSAEQHTNMQNDNQKVAVPMNKSAFAQADEIVIAINVGGDSYQANSGIVYQADALGTMGKMGRFDVVKGSQDAELFKTYREGALDITLPMENGRYDIIFQFAEPAEIPVGERVFDVFANGNKVIDTMDVRLARDGNIRSNLERAVWGVKVADGQLNIALKPIKGEPILSGIIVRKPHVKASDWKLVWQDEFDYEGYPNPDKWGYDEWPARKVNDEDQTYTKRLKNARVENGHLIIEAHKEKFNNAEYSSARLNTLGKMDFLYGRVEVKAKLPAGQGTWSAIWMLPSDPYKYSTTCKPGEDWQGSATCDAWPNSGEIDIMEHVGYDMNNIHGTVHTKAYYWANWEQRKGSVEGQTVESDFHVYALEWTPETITIFFNDTPYFIYFNEGTGWEAWPFDHAYNLILNLAIGGMWGRAGGSIDDSIFPVRMEVDYVRIYQRE